MRGSAAGVPGCQRMPVPRQGPRGTPGHSGTWSTGSRAWLTERMEAAYRSGGVVNYTINSLLQCTALNPLRQMAAIRGGMTDHPMHTGGMKWKLTARGPGLVGIRLAQVLGVVLSPIRYAVEDREAVRLGGHLRAAGTGYGPVGGPTTDGQTSQEASTRDVEGCREG